VPVTPRTTNASAQMQAHKHTQHHAGGVWREVQ
jgi:hypothetical protein